MLPTAYGAVYIFVAAAGFAALSYFAIRLMLYGAATVDQGKAKVFETFEWTRGQVKTLAAASGSPALPAIATLLAPCDTAELKVCCTVNTRLKPIMPVVIIMLIRQHRWGVVRRGWLVG